MRCTLGSVLIYMRRHRLPVDDISHDALLKRASGHNNTKRVRVGLPPTVADDVNDQLPADLTSRLAAIVLIQVGNILHDALHSRCKEAVVLVVHDHDDDSVERVIVDLTGGGATSRGKIAHGLIPPIIRTHLGGRRGWRTLLGQHEIAMEESGQASGSRRYQPVLCGEELNGRHTL